MSSRENVEGDETKRNEQIGQGLKTSAEVVSAVPIVGPLVGQIFNMANEFRHHKHKSIEKAASYVAPSASGPSPSGPSVMHF